MSTYQAVLSTGTGLSDAVRNINATSNAQVADLNAKLVADYQTTYANYVERMQSGGVVSPADQAVPAPPTAYVLSAPDANGFTYPQVGDAPVCSPGAAVTYLGGLAGARRDPSHIDIGRQISGSWYSVGPLDGTPNGFITPPQADGHTYQKVGAPVGAGWYLRLG